MTEQEGTLSDLIKLLERWGSILYTVKQLRWWIIGAPIVLVALRMLPGINDPCGTATTRLEDWKEIVRNKHYHDYHGGQQPVNYQAHSNKLEFEKYLACKEWKHTIPSRKIK